MLGIIEPVRGGESRTPLANAPTSPDVSVALSEEDSGVSGSRQHVYDLISRFDNTGINKGSLPLPKAASWARSRLASTARTSQSKREEDQVVDVEPVPVFECPKSLADWVKESSTLKREEDGVQYLLLPKVKLASVAAHRTKELLVQEFGVGPQELGFTEPTPTLPPIKLLLIDPIGDRNATTLNSLVNYLYGVKLDDPFRFILIDQADHEAAEVTGGSKTDCVNVYTLKKTIFGRPVVLVDTPGNVDARETRMRDMLHAALRQGSALPILNGSITALCFVLKAAKIRDTVFFKYTIEHILSLFAKDIASNVAFMVTRTDNKDPPLKEIIMSLDTAIECTGERFFCFNDSGSFDPDAGDTVVENGFELGTACFDNFFKNLANRKDVATRSSATVIEQIRKLEELAEFLQKAVRDLLSVLDLNKQIKSKIAQLDEKMLDSNPYKKKPFTDREHFVTNCTQCYRTCHYPCGIRKDDHKDGCSVMGTNGYCCTCPGRCHWTMHANHPSIWEVNEMEERTVKDLKQNFDIAAKEKATEVSLLDDCQGKIISLCRDFGSTFHELRETLDKLEKLSLRKTAALTDSKYIETLIKAIEDEKNPVTVKTVSQLRQQLELAGILEKCTAAEDEEDALRKFVSHEFEGDSAREDEGNVRIIKEAEERYRQSYGNIGSFFKRIF